jgi:hypothetical protein
MVRYFTSYRGTTLAVSLVGYVFESGSGLMPLHSRFMLLISTNDRYK